MSLTVYMAVFLFIGVLYFGFDGIKAALLRMTEVCRKGGLFGAAGYISGWNKNLSMSEVAENII